jgi:hypothetical protein
MNENEKIFGSPNNKLEEKKIIEQSFVSKGRMNEEIINESKRYLDNLNEAEDKKEEVEMGESLSALEDEKKKDRIEDQSTNSEKIPELTNTENEEEKIEINNEELVENKAEQDLERKLATTRTEYAKTCREHFDKQSEKYTKTDKLRIKLNLPPKNEQPEKDSLEIKEAKKKYLEAIHSQRKEMREKAKTEIELLDLNDKEKNKLLEKKFQDIAKITVAKEAILLNDEKKELKLEEKEGEDKATKMLKYAGKVVEKYQKMPLKKKLAISALLLGGGLAAASISGATGIALATGIVSGKWLQRALSGSATAIGLEGLMKKSQEKKASKEVTSELGDKLKESLENNDEKLDKKLFELEGEKQKQKYWRYALAGSAGVLIGSGLVGKALSGIMPDEWGNWIKNKFNFGDKTPEVTPISDTAEVTPPLQETIVAPKLEAYSIKSGDRLWDVLKTKVPKIDNLERLGMKDNTVANLIETIKDDPEAYGITSGNIDNLNIGDKIDMERIQDLLENEKIGGESLIDHAQRLDETTLKEIENYQPESEPIDSPGNEGIESELQATQVESQAIKDVTTRLTNIGSHHSPLNIFSLGTDQFMETGGEWDQLRKLPTTEVLSKNFDCYEHLDGLENNAATNDNIKGLLQYINEAQGEIKAPIGKENLEDYLKRYEASTSS